MNNIFENTIITTSVLVVCIVMFIGAAIDMSLIWYWKIVVCTFSTVLILGSIKELSDESKKTKKFMSNREDLR